MDGRRLVRCILLAVVVAGALPGPAIHAARPTKRAPHPGVYVRDDWEGLSRAIPWASGSAVHVGWAQLEPEVGQYDFSMLDSWLAVLDRAGKRGAFGLLLRCADDETGMDACAPSWALAWDPVMVAGVPRLNYLAPEVHDRLRALIDALAQRYAGDVRLSHVEVNLGYRGEASPCPHDADEPDGPAQCEAYREHYAVDPSGWETYLADTLEAYASAFRMAGGPGHTPLQVTMTGRFIDDAERALLVNTALDLGMGLHDMRLAAGFLTGESQDGRCAHGWRTEEPGYSDANAYASHWVPLERLWRQAPVSFEFSRWPRKAEAALTDEENVWWSVLNALDKHARVIYADKDALEWEGAWRIFNAYAGRNERTTPDAWIALRGTSDVWCGDAGDYEWYLHHRREAAGDSGRFYGVSQPDGRVGDTWAGAYSRGTDQSGSGRSLYFDVDDAFMYGGEHVVLVEVTYWDGTPDMAGWTWEMSYDSAQAPNQSAGTVTLEGSDRLLTHGFTLIDAAFRNRLPDATGARGNDLRLWATGRGDIRFHEVRLKELAEIAKATRQPPPTPTAPLAAKPTPSPALPMIAQGMSDDYPTAVPTVVLPTPSPTPSATVTVHSVATVPAITSTPVAPGSDLVLRQVRGQRPLVQDTFISADEPTANFVEANTLTLSGNGRQQPLLMFDLHGLTEPAAIEDAWLNLTVVARGEPGTVRVSALPAPEAWEPDQITWEIAEARAWPGIGPGVSAVLPEGAGVLLPAQGAVQIPVTELVRVWLEDPTESHGFLLQGQGDEGAEYYLASSEWRTLGARPRLQIQLVEAGAVQPSPTPMASATPSPTYTAPATATIASTATPTAVPLAYVSRIARIEPATDDPDGSTLDIRAYVYPVEGAGELCGQEPVVRLWGAAGQSPARSLGEGTRRTVVQDGQTFAVWDFDDVDYAALREEDPLAHFFVTVDGEPSIHNVVTWGPERGTDYPDPIAPVRASGAAVEGIDASIEILWPHDDVAVEEADLANISVALFRAGTREVLPLSEDAFPQVELHWSINDGLDLAGATPPLGQPRRIQAPWLTYYLWEFFDVDVSVARQSGQYLNFWIEVEGIEGAAGTAGGGTLAVRTNVWSHGYGPHLPPDAPVPETSCAYAEP